MTTADKRGRDLSVGDVIVWLGREYPITHFVTHPRSILGPAARIACSGPGWGLTVLPDTPVRVRVPACEQGRLTSAA